MNEPKLTAKQADLLRKIELGPIILDKDTWTIANQLELHGLAEIHCLYNAIITPVGTRLLAKLNPVLIG